MQLVKEQLPKLLTEESINKYLLNYTGGSDEEYLEKFFVGKFAKNMVLLVKKAILDIKKVGFEEDEFLTLAYHFRISEGGWHPIDKEHMLLILGQVEIYELNSTNTIVSKVELLNDIQCVALILMANEYSWWNNKIGMESLLNGKEFNSSELFKKYMNY